jgi:hypothetical protein
MAKEKTTAETKEFQAEVKKLLDIVIHSLYTERDIFVRELISNSADALEKFRHQSLLEEEVFDSHMPLEIAIDVDEKNHTLTISDSGIGMTREELSAPLPTPAQILFSPNLPRLPKRMSASSASLASAFIPPLWPAKRCGFCHVPISRMRKGMSGLQTAAAAIP